MLVKSKKIPYLQYQVIIIYRLDTRKDFYRKW